MKIKEKQEFNNDSQLVNIENCEIEDDNERPEIQNSKDKKENKNNIYYF